MTALEEQLISKLNDVVVSHGLYIDELHYKRKGKENVLEIYVEREDMSPVDLDTIVDLSEDLSTKLDEIDLINEEYCLDVSSSGAERPIKDFRKFPLLIGKYMEIRLNNPIKGLNIYEGTLEEVKDQSIVLSYKEKTRTLKVEIETTNITKAKLTVKI